MSVSSVVRAKRELASLGLIHIKEVTTGRGRKAHHITAREIWPVNNAFFDLEEKPTVSAGCKWGLDAGGNLVEFEVGKDDAGQIVCKSSTVVLLVPQMEQSNNQRGKTYRKNQQHGGEKNDVGTGADAVADGSSSFQNLLQPAHGPSENEAHPGGGNGRVKANRNALAEYGVMWTRGAQAVAVRPDMTPAFIRAWGKDVQARSDVVNKPAYLLALLRTATDPPNERKGDNGRCSARQRVSHRRFAGSRRGPPDDWPTEEEKAAAWETHGDRLLAWIQKRGTDANLGACVNAVSKALNITQKTAGDLVLAYETHKPHPGQAVAPDDV